MNAEPRWMSRTDDNGWDAHAEKLAEWRAACWTLGDLEQQLLALVTTGTATGSGIR